ncbi:MAG: LysR family transcriptional regulator, partial [Proteobacteria bacterium]|nr:LysR family transcriptional regulator [Pseudomonadota bacterium]
MQYYKHMAIFVVLVDTGSFTAAAQRLGTAKSAVSRYVSELEEHLGVVLLQRTTRQFSITEAGQRYYESCARMVAEAEAAEEAVRDLQSEATGTLRFSAPVRCGFDIIMPALIEFTERYPKLDVNVTLDNRAIDLVEEGIDLAVRFGRVTSPSLIARQLATT